MWNIQYHKITLGVSLMMKYKFLILMLTITYHLNGQNALKNDNKNALNIEIGYPSFIFLNHFNQKTFYYQKNSFYDLDIIMPRLICVNYKTNKNLNFGIQYKRFYSLNYSNTLQYGEIRKRDYHAIDLFFGKTFISKKLNIHYTPNLILSARPKGYEIVHIYTNPSIPDLSATTAYNYKSIGFGGGINAKKYVYKGLNISLDIQLNHFFEKNKFVSKPAGGFDEFHKTYKVNKDVIVFAFKIGYEFNLHKL